MNYSYLNSYWYFSPVFWFSAVAVIPTPKDKVNKIVVSSRFSFSGKSISQLWSKLTPWSSQNFASLPSVTYKSKFIFCCNNDRGLNFLVNLLSRGNLAPRCAKFSKATVNPFGSLCESGSGCFHFRTISVPK